MILSIAERGEMPCSSRMTALAVSILPWVLRATAWTENAELRVPPSLSCSWHCSFVKRQRESLPGCCDEASQQKTLIELNITKSRTPSRSGRVLRQPSSPSSNAHSTASDQAIRRSTKLVDRSLAYVINVHRSSAIAD